MITSEMVYIGIYLMNFCHHADAAVESICFVLSRLQWSLRSTIQQCQNLLDTS